MAEVCGVKEVFCVCFIVLFPMEDTENIFIFRQKRSGKVGDFDNGEKKSGELLEKYS